MGSILYPTRTIVNDNEVIPGAGHFFELQFHGFGNVTLHPFTIEWLKLPTLIAQDYLNFNCTKS
jgi:hypothetical protein